jgi:hypothetical protein
LTGLARDAVLAAGRGEGTGAFDRTKEHGSVSARFGFIRNYSSNKMRSIDDGIQGLHSAQAILRHAQFDIL